MSQPPSFNPDQLAQLLQQPGFVPLLSQALAHLNAAASLTPDGTGSGALSAFDHNPQLGPPAGVPSSTPHTAPTPAPSSGATGPFQSVAPAPTQAPDPSALLRPYVSRTPTSVGPIYSSAHAGPSTASTGNPTAGPSLSVAFGPPLNTIAGHPIAITANNTPSFATSAASFLPQQHPTLHHAPSSATSFLPQHHPTLHPAPSAGILTPSSPFPSFSSAQQHASQQRASAIVKHRASGLRTQAHRGAGGSGLGTNPIIPVIAILYPIAPGLPFEGSPFGGEVVLHQNRRAAFRERAAHLGLAVALQVHRDTDTLLVVQQRVRQALENGRAQLQFVGLDDLLAGATTNSDRLPFQVMSTCRRGYTRKDGNVYHKPHMAPLTDNDMLMVNYVNHRELAHPKRVYWEGNTLLMYLMSKVPVEGHIPAFNDQVPHRCLMARLTCGLKTDQHAEQLPGYQRWRHGPPQPVTQQWHEPGGNLTSESEDEDEEDLVITPDTSMDFTIATSSSSSHVALTTPVPSSSGTSGTRQRSTASSPSALASGSSGLPSTVLLPSTAISSSASHLLDPTSQLPFSPAYLSTLSHEDELLSPLTPSILGLDDQVPPEMPASLVPDSHLAPRPNEETVNLLAKMPEYPSHKPFAKRASSSTHRLHYFGLIPTTRSRWGWKFLEDAERDNERQTAPLHIHGEDFHSEVVPSLKSHMMMAIRNNNASRIFQANFTITTVSPDGGSIARGVGLIREAITEIYQKLELQCQPYLHTTPSGYKVVHSDESEVSPSVHETLKLFGLVHAMHLVWAHAAAPFTSPVYLQLLLHGGELSAVTPELLDSWEPTVLEVLTLWADLGLAGSLMEEPIKSTLEELFPGVQVECLPQVRTAQQHNQIWHMMLQTLITGSLHVSPIRRAFESGFSLPLPNGWTIVKASGAHCYRSSTSDFVNDLCGHHIQSAQEVLSQIIFTFSPPNGEQDVTTALQDASLDPTMTFPSLLKAFLSGSGPVSDVLLRTYIQDGRITYLGDLAELNDGGYRARLFSRAVCGSLSLPAQIQVIFDSGRSLASQHGEVFIRSCLSQITLPTQTIIKCFRRDHVLEPEGDGLDTAKKAFEFWLLRNLMNSLGSYGTG